MRGAGSLRHQFPGGIFYPGGKARLVDEALQRLVIGVSPPVCAESPPDEDVVNLKRDQNLQGKRERDGSGDPRRRRLVFQRSMRLMMATMTSYRNVMLAEKSGVTDMAAAGGKRREDVPDDVLH